MAKKPLNKDYLYEGVSQLAIPEQARQRSSNAQLAAGRNCTLRYLGNLVRSFSEMGHVSHMTVLVHRSL